MADQTEPIRREMVNNINAIPTDREVLEIEYGKVWDTKELSADFTVDSFAAPFIIVTEKSTGKKGALMFQHNPRFYFDFAAI